MIMNLFGEFSNFQELSYRSISTKYYGKYSGNIYNFNPGIILKSNYSYQKGNVNFVTENNFFYSQESSENRNSLLFNQLFASLSYDNNGIFSFKNYLRNYDTSQTEFNYLPGNENRIKKNMNNLLLITYDKKISEFEFDGFLGLRNLDYIDENRNNYSDSDFYSKINITYPLSEKINFNISSLIKNDLNESKNYNYAKIGCGSELKNLIPKNQINIDYYQLNSKSIDKLFKHNFVFDIRQRFQLFANVYGFFRYKSHNLFSEKFYRLNNLIRLQTKYKFLKNTFLSTGLRYSVEHENLLYFAEVNHNFYRSFKGNVGIQNSSGNYHKLFCEIKYYMSQKLQFWIRNENTDYLDKMKMNEIFIGITTNL